MGRAQLADGLYDAVTDRAEFVTGQDAPLLPPLCTGARLMLGITAGLIAFTCLTWVAVLLRVAGWLADLIWGHPPWSFLTYIGLALVAAGVIGYWTGREPSPGGGTATRRRRWRPMIAPVSVVVVLTACDAPAEPRHGAPDYEARLAEQATREALDMALAWVRQTPSNARAVCQRAVHAAAGDPSAATGTAVLTRVVVPVADQPGRFQVLGQVDAGSGPRAPIPRWFACAVRDGRVVALRLEPVG